LAQAFYHRAFRNRDAIQDRYDRDLSIEKLFEFSSASVLHGDDNTGIFRKRSLGDPVPKPGQLGSEIACGLREVGRADTWDWAEAGSAEKIKTIL
jgi:hypothetical protein